MDKTTDFLSSGTGVVQWIPEGMMNDLSSNLPLLRPAVHEVLQSYLVDKPADGQRSLRFLQDQSRGRLAKALRNTGINWRTLARLVSETNE
ncbi:hypothetical protein RvY_19028 [Ramazzottius varieornatus]|uniref:Uncharacterized protein n=1 Tax=Ramazzottius varieornatus TaxID=947166 RepID=A0A1D1W987_RAMVA|nr:hypothetical protein RvY_19028 [Ramazzottius varieornatus]